MTEVSTKQVFEYFKKKEIALSKIKIEEIITLFQMLKKASENNSRVFIAGNGGSASTAEHFVADLGIGSHIRGARNKIDAHCLNSNVAVITALSNDTSYDYVFSKQLELLSPKPSDVVIVISASGNSSNILNLLETARSLRLTSCALIGFDGGRAQVLADFVVHVPTEFHEYGIVEDLHLSICHLVTELLRK
jgi:D-sedoheptulose 7-phosphate isomerase